VDQPLTQPATPRPNWWKRNRKWFVPLSCFTVALLFLAFIGSILVIVFSAMKSPDVYKEALARAKADPAVIEALGSPIRDGFPASGSTNVTGASGESKQWNYSGLVVEVGQTHQRIDRLHGSAPASSP
jgi:hypothetical protein